MQTPGFRVKQIPGAAIVSLSFPFCWRIPFYRTLPSCLRILL